MLTFTGGANWLEEMGSLRMEVASLISAGRTHSTSLARIEEEVAGFGRSLDSLAQQYPTSTSTDLDTWTEIRDLHVQTSQLLQNMDVRLQEVEKSLMGIDLCPEPTYNATSHLELSLSPQFDIWFYIIGSQLVIWGGFTAWLCW